MIVDEATIEKHVSIDFTIIAAFTSGEIANISTRAESLILTARRRSTYESLSLSNKCLENPRNCR